MSLILDAFKKLDREKSSHRKGTANIAVEILKPDPRRPQKRTVLYFAAFLLTAGVAAAITYGVVGGSLGFLRKTSPPAAVIPPAPGQQTASVLQDSSAAPKPSPPASVKPPALRQRVTSVSPKPGPLPKSSPSGSGELPAPNQQAVSASPKSGAQPKSAPPASAAPPEVIQRALPAPSSGEPVPGVREEITQVPPKIPESGESKAPTSTPVEEKASQRVLSKGVEVAPGSVRRAPESVPKESATTLPQLKISGIVWHEEPSDRRAVINGSFVKEGAVIEGVKVLEIFPTRVRFSHNGRTFEISVFE